MKRMICLLFLTLFVSVFLCGCGGDDSKKTAEEIGDSIETFASEVKDNVDGMIDDGKVNDGDGYIGNHGKDDEPDTEAPTVPADGMTDGVIFDADPTENSDHI